MNCASRRKRRGHNAVQQAGDRVVTALRHTAATNSGELRFPPQAVRA
ncbi:hypothetical protein [uncultured Cardiobacterium sp.]|nr:hypothetical protein [uncultured Cardiobacterium sp.]